MIPFPCPLSAMEVLARLDHEPHVVLLESCGQGWSYLGWGADGVDGLPQRSLPTDPAPTSRIDHGWWGRRSGAAFVQIDYEGGARHWHFPQVLAWNPHGECFLDADAAGSARVAALIERRPGVAALPLPTAPPRAARDRDAHCRQIRRVQAYIAAGDCYQANLTLPWYAPLQRRLGDDRTLLHRLLTTSPAPYAGLIRDGGRSIVSHSPECLISSRDRIVVSQPIKGTRRRVAGRDDAVRRELLHADKDRAELAMIVDLMRNDLGRVAEAGSVTVRAAARIMDLSYVHHLVGDIAAELRQEVDLADLIEACFPAGSITGAPKRRAMDILRELEVGPRGPYCGSFGWATPDGDGQLNVAIRSLVLDADHIRCDAGGGIVADSDPVAEYAEAEAKASVMLEALRGR